MYQRLERGVYNEEWMGGVSREERNWGEGGQNSKSRVGSCSPAYCAQATDHLAASGLSGYLWPEPSKAALHGSSS